jgi:hypothetical protein
MPRALTEAPVTFDPYSQVDGTITSIFPVSNGQYIIAGTFTTYNKIPRN